jgi:hypothetical protein
VNEPFPNDARMRYLFHGGSPPWFDHRLHYHKSEAKVEETALQFLRATGQPPKRLLFLYLSASRT